MRKSILTISLLGCVLLFSNLHWKETSNIVPDLMPVQELLKKLDAPENPFLPKKETKGVTLERGRDIVLKGRAEKPSGGQSDRVSKHFVCTSCHNVERDEPNLTATDDPLARLRYVKEKGLPFLQGSALYGIIDRRDFYNGDYEKKYGKLVEPARKDLRQAIHLCATECAQGRPLEEWEMESVIAYLWTIGLKTGDLGLSEEEKQKIGAAILGKTEKTAALELVQSKYITGFPATFIDPPADRQAGFSATGDPAVGKLVYELSCLHCHEGERYSFFNLDKSMLSLAFLAKHAPNYSRYSIYQVARYGTSPIPGKKAYMPHFTKEKMSEQMLEDLRAYLMQELK